MKTLEMSKEHSKMALWAARLSAKTTQLRNELSNISTEKLATLSGSELQGGKLVLNCLFETYETSVHDFTIRKQNGERAHPLIESLILTYLHTADGIPVAGRWVNFRELPEGKMYHQAFQGYASDQLTKRWGNNIQGFIAACKTAGGQSMNYGDASFSVPLLPRIIVAPTYWIGDEDFPPKASILFDANVHHYMVTDGLAVMGSQLVKRLLTRLRLMDDPYT
jgi:hypothetical protein